MYTSPLCREIPVDISSSSLLVFIAAKWSKPVSQALTHFSAAAVHLGCFWCFYKHVCVTLPSTCEGLTKVGAGAHYWAARWGIHTFAGATYLFCSETRASFPPPWYHRAHLSADGHECYLTGILPVGPHIFSYLYQDDQPHSEHSDFHLLCWNATFLTVHFYDWSFRFEGLLHFLAILFLRSCWLKCLLVFSFIINIWIMYYLKMSTSPKLLNFLKNKRLPLI